MYVEYTTVALWGNPFAVKKTISVKYSECVFVASSIQLAVGMYCVILPSVACLAVWHISTLSKN
jgi:hypothetical protein